MASNTGKFAAFCQKLATADSIPPFIFYIGENPDELNNLLAILREKLVGRYGSCDEVHLSGLDNDAASWHAELLTMPMFPSGRLIQVRHAEALFKRIEAQAKVLVSYVRDFPIVPEFTITLLQCKEKKISKKLQALEERALLYEDIPLSAAELSDQLLDRAAALGYKTDRDVMELVVDKSAAVQKTVYANFDRLLIFRLHEKEICIEDVEELVGNSESNMHFRLLDETARRNIPECLQILQLHILEDANQLIAALIKLFSESLRHHYYIANGMQLTEIGQIISARPLTGYPLKKSAERWTLLIQRYSVNGVRQIMDALLRADKLCKENSDSSAQQTVLTSFYLMLSKTN